MTGLLDGDIIAYKSAFLNANNAGDIEDLSRLINGMVRDWTQRAGVKDFYICLGSPDLFRHDLVSDYKANRSDKPKPSLLTEAYEMVCERFACLRLPRCEADDVMGIMVSHKSHVIITTDKDLRTVPGLHFHPDKGYRVERITEEQAERSFCTQWLTGDPGDNFKGCPGIGKKKAQTLIEKTRRKDLYREILAEYKRRGVSRADAITQGRLARILTADLWDSRRSKPILWKPQ